MRRISRLLSLASILSLPLILRAQEVQVTTGTEMLARLEYDTSAAMSRGDVRRVCLAISNDGEFRIIRSTTDKPTQYLLGQLPKDEFQALKNLLSSKEFRSQTGTLGGLIRQDSESFRAELPIQRSQLKKRADGTYVLPESDAWRLEWLNADNAAPFPHSISKVVNWLQRFEPKNGKELSNAEFSNVCPFGGLRLVEPSIADSQRP